MQLLALRTSARVAPGLLSAPAWDALRAAPAVLLAPRHPLLAPLREAGLAPLAVGSPAAVVGAALAVGEAAGAQRTPVVWCAPVGPDDEEARAQVAADAAAAGVAMATLSGATDLPGAGVVELVAVMDRLRSPGGCPWDAAQTHDSLLRYLVEETFETVEAVEAGDDAALLEELGDLLLQVVFHARIATERTDGFSIDDVAAGVSAKLVRRHPHVFAGAAAGDTAALQADWDAVKRAEKGRRSVLQGVPLGQPALALAASLGGRAARAGVHVAPPAPAGVDVAPGPLGRALLGLAVAAEAAGVDPEAALRAAVRDFAAAVRAAEAAAGPAGDARPGL